MTVIGGGAGGKGSNVCSGGGESAIRRRLAGETVRARGALVFGFSAAAAAAAFSAAVAFLGETGLLAVADLLGETGAEGRPRGRTGEPWFVVEGCVGLAGERGCRAGRVGKGGASSDGGAPRGCLDEDRVVRTLETGSAGLEEPNLPPGPWVLAQISFLFLFLLGDVFGSMVGGASVSVSVPETWALTPAFLDAMMDVLLTGAE